MESTFARERTFDPEKGRQLLDMLDKPNRKKQKKQTPEELRQTVKSLAISDVRIDEDSIIDAALRQNITQTVGLKEKIDPKTIHDIIHTSFETRIKKENPNYLNDFPSEPFGRKLRSINLENFKGNGWINVHQIKLASDLGTSISSHPGYPLDGFKIISPEHWKNNPELEDVLKDTTSFHVQLQCDRQDRSINALWTVSATECLFTKRLPGKIVLIEKYLCKVIYVGEHLIKTNDSSTSYLTLQTYDLSGHPVIVLLPSYTDEQITQIRALQGLIVVFENLKVGEHTRGAGVEVYHQLTYSMNCSSLEVIWDVDQWEGEPKEGQPSMFPSLWPTIHGSNIDPPTYTAYDCGEMTLTDAQDYCSFLGFMAGPLFDDKETDNVFGINFTASIQFRVILSNEKDIVDLSRITSHHEVGQLCLFANLVKRISKANSNPYFLFVYGLSIIIPIYDKDGSRIIHLPNEMTEAFRTFANATWSHKFLYSTIQTLDVMPQVIGSYIERGFPFPVFCNSIQMVNLKCTISYDGLQQNTAHKWDWYCEIGQTRKDLYAIVHHICKKRLGRYHQALEMGFVECPKCGKKWLVEDLYRYGWFDPSTAYPEDVFDLVWDFYVKFGGALFIRFSNKDVVRAWTSFASPADYIAECKRQGRFTYGWVQDVEPDVMVMIFAQIGRAHPNVDLTIQLSIRTKITPEEKKRLSAGHSFFWSSIKFMKVTPTNPVYRILGDTKTPFGGYKLSKPDGSPGSEWKCRYCSNIVR
jgi:hypothetical protein